MTWVRVDDRALLHPKLLAAGPDGVTLWLAGLCYCNAHHTDGFITKSAVGALYPSDEWTRSRQLRAAKRLVELGAWHDEGDSWRVHGYAEYQEEALRENVAERREYERERKKRQREAKKAQREPAMSRRDSPGHDAGTPSGQSEVSARAVSAPPSEVSQPPGPARPGPARPDPVLEERARSPENEGRFRAAVAFKRAIEAASPGAIFDALGDRAFYEVGPLAMKHAEQVGRPLDDVLDEWMREWLALGEKRVPAFWKQWCIGKAAGNANGSRSRPTAYVALKAKPGEYGGGDFGDEDIPTAGEPQKVIGYG
jgi:hypothetical protein